MRATITIYDFGAVSVEYRVPFAGTLEHLVALSSELYDTQRFARDARQRAESLLGDISSAVRRPLSDPRRKIIWSLRSRRLDDGRVKPAEFVNDHQPVLAQVLSSNTKALARQQMREELRRTIAYFDDDLTIITWNAALMFGTQMEDVLTVLELANVQLRELHYLDDRLDSSLQESYDLRAQTKSVNASMQRIREMMLDGQAFSEAVTNAFKPFPDAFSARVYALGPAHGAGPFRPQHPGQTEPAQHAVHDPGRRSGPRSVRSPGVDCDHPDFHRDPDGTRGEVLSFVAKGAGRGDVAVKRNLFASGPAEDRD